MKKSIFYKGILLLLFCLGLSGCGDSGILEEIPRDFAMVTPSSEEQSILSLAEVEAAVVTKEEAESFLCEDSFEYARDKLSDTEQLWYDDMKQCLGSYGEKVKLNEAGIESGYDETKVDQIFQAVLNDHPELFYVEGYSYTKYGRGNKISAIEFSGTYSMDKETAVTRYQDIETAVAEILSGLEENADQYTRVKYVYDTIIRNTEYKLGAPDNQNIYSVFVNHLSVCQGYAKATQYLLNRLGVECALVLGTVDTGEGHAWNLVKIDGSYYYVDTTWGDASYRMEDNGSAGSVSMPEISYDYLNVTSTEIFKTHTPREGMLMPACVATEANYYSREGSLFFVFDREQLETLFETAVEQGRKDVTVKCGDEAVYEEVMTALIQGQEIFDYWDEVDGTIAYTQNENQLSLTFWVTND